MYEVTIYGHVITPDSNGNNTKLELDNAVLASNATKLTFYALEINGSLETSEGTTNVNGYIVSNKDIRDVLNIVSYIIDNSDWITFLRTFKAVKKNYKYTSLYIANNPYNQLDYFNVPTQIDLGGTSQSNIGDYKTITIPVKVSQY